MARLESCGLVDKANERESAGQDWLVEEEPGRTWYMGVDFLQESF